MTTSIRTADFCPLQKDAHVLCKQIHLLPLVSGYRQSAFCLCRFCILFRILCQCSNTLDALLYNFLCLGWFSFILLCISIDYSFLCISSILLYGYILFSIHYLSIGGSLDCFHYLAVPNKDAMNINIYVLVCFHFSRNRYLWWNGWEAAKIFSKVVV